jgi:hypothetical protein
VNDEVSNKKTLLESCSIFQVMGASFGIYLVLIKLKNPDWDKTGYANRLLKGTIAFALNYIIIYFPSIAILTQL